MSTRIIKLNRGDSLKLPIPIPNNYCPLTSNDAFYFAVLYPHQNFEDAIILKACSGTDSDVITDAGENGDETVVMVSLSPRETGLLAPGIYYYTAKLKRGGDLEILDYSDEPKEVHTIIERTKFIINE